MKCTLTPGDGATRANSHRARRQVRPNSSAQVASPEQVWLSGPNKDALRARAQGCMKTSVRSATGTAKTFI